MAVCANKRGDDDLLKRKISCCAAGRKVLHRELTFNGVEEAQRWRWWECDRASHQPRASGRLAEGVWRPRAQRILRRSTVDSLPPNPYGGTKVDFQYMTFSLLIHRHLAATEKDGLGGSRMHMM